MNARDSRSLRGKHIPGELGVWFLVFGDLLVYGLLFLAYAWDWRQQPTEFAQSQARLTLGFGVINTLILLTSSWCVAKGVQAAREDSNAASAKWFGRAFLCGGTFVFCKAIEYGTKGAQGISPTISDFFMYYYVITGFHLLHVLVGIAVLVFMRKAVKSPRQAQPILPLLENGATFWHLVDVLWIAIFPLIYLLGVSR